MTERERRQQSGERDLVSVSRGETTRRIYLSFTPTLVQLLVGLAVLIGGFWTAHQWYESNVLLPRAMTYVYENGKGEMQRIAGTHATKDDLLLLQNRMDALETATEVRSEQLAEELRYIRARLDAIADRVGAK